jgi:hypothetical protein
MSERNAREGSSGSCLTCNTEGKFPFCDSSCLFDFEVGQDAMFHDLTELQTETQSLQRRIEELETCLRRLMKANHIAGWGNGECHCAAHEEARDLLSPKEQP